MEQRYAANFKCSVFSTSQAIGFFGNESQQKIQKTESLTPKISSHFRIFSLLKSIEERTSFAFLSQTFGQKITNKYKEKCMLAHINLFLLSRFR